MVGACSLAQQCQTLCDPIDCSRPGPSVHGSLHTRIVGWVAIPFSRIPSLPRDRTRICVAGGFFTILATWEGPYGLHKDNYKHPISKLVIKILEIFQSMHFYLLPSPTLHPPPIPLSHTHTLLFIYSGNTCFQNLLAFHTYNSTCKLSLCLNHFLPQDCLSFRPVLSSMIATGHMDYQALEMWLVWTEICCKHKIHAGGNSLVVQWLRFCLPMQGVWV